MTTGLISTAVIPTDLARKSYAAVITRLMPNGGAPLFALTALLKDETANAIEHGYYTKTMIFPSATLSAAVADGNATSFAVAANSDIVPGDLLQADSTSEIVLVTSVPSGTALNVQRAVGTTAGAAIASGVVLRHIGNAFEQGSLRPQAVSLVATRYMNYTQIFRNSWAVTKTLAALQMIAGDGAVAESKRDCAAFHAMAIEKSLFFGQKFQGSRNGQPFQTMEGMIPRIISAAPGNVVTMGATTNWTQLEAALDNVLNVQTDAMSSNIRTCFVGGVGKRVLTNIARLNSSYDISSTTSSWGLRIESFKTARGMFELIEHPLFNAYGNSSTWAKMMIIMDLNAFSIAYLRKTEDLSYNAAGTVTDNGIDAQGGTLTTELTCLIKNPAAFGIIYNLTAAAAG